MIRALKKLKAWSKKRAKKRKRDLLDGVSTRSTPPPCCACCCCCCSSSAPQFQPTAPPLPPWLGFQRHREVISDPVPPSTPSVVFPPPVAETSVRWLPPTTGNGSEIAPLYAPAPCNSKSILSYQKYMVPDPVFGVPIGPPAPAEHGSGPAGCSNGVEIWLRRCLCCCLGNGN